MDQLYNGQYIIPTYFCSQNSATLKTPSTIEAEYCRILNLRDLFWVQQLMTEKRLGRHLYKYISFKHLADVRTMVNRAEEAALYIKEIAEMSGWVLDFNAMNQRRCAALPADHPLCLIQPYIRINLTPFASSNDTDSTTSTSDSDQS